MADKKPKVSFDYKKLLKQTSDYLVTYRVIVVSPLLLVVFSFVVLRTNSQLDPGLNEDRYNEQSVTLKKVTFDEDAIQDIQELIDSGIEINSRFVERNNPFAE